VLRHPSSASDRLKSTAAQRQIAEGGEARPIGPPGFLFLDPPDHTRLRKLVSKAFAPKVVKALEADITAMVDSLLDQVAVAGRFEVINDLAHPLPVAVICRLLGVPIEDEPQFSHASALLAAALDPVSSFTGQAPDSFNEMFQAGLWLREYLRDLMARRRSEPGDDLMSALIHVEESGDQLTEEEIIATCNLLLVAGHETTVNLIAHSVLSLLRYPDQLEKLRRRPELIVPGVDELLRFESSVQFWHTRTALEDIEIAGTTIPKGATIFVVYGSANRDPERFENPDELDLERPNNEHLGFSQGIHYCFGAPLARLEVQIAVSEFFRRVENPRLVVDPPPYRHNQIFRGPRHLLVDIDGVRD
jgi:cytochrome P450